MLAESLPIAAGGAHQQTCQLWSTAANYTYFSSYKKSLKLLYYSATLSTRTILIHWEEEKSVKKNVQTTNMDLMAIQLQINTYIKLAF